MTNSDFVIIVGAFWMLSVLLPKSLPHRTMLLLLLMCFAVVLAVSHGLDHVSGMFNDPNRFWFLS